MPAQVFSPGLPAAGRVTPSAFPFYTSGEDNLRLISRAILAFQTVQLVYRYVNERGGVDVGVATQVSSPGDGTPQSTDIPLSGRTLLNARIGLTQTGVQYGEVYVELQMIRGLGAAAVVVGTLIQGNISGAVSRGFPGSPIDHALEGPGAIQTVNSGAIALQTNLNLPFTTGERVEVLSVVVLLSTAAGGQNRTVGVKFLQSGVNPIAYAVSPLVQAPSTVVVHSFSQGLALTAAAAPDVGVSGLPIGLQLRATDVVQTFIEAFGANDQILSSSVSIRRWVDIL